MYYSSASSMSEFLPFPALPKKPIVNTNIIVQPPFYPIAAPTLANAGYIFKPEPTGTNCMLSWYTAHVLDSSGTKPMRDNGIRHVVYLSLTNTSTPQSHLIPRAISSPKYAKILPKRMSITRRKVRKTTPAKPYSPRTTCRELPPAKKLIGPTFPRLIYLTSWPLLAAYNAASIPNGLALTIPIFVFLHTTVSKLKFVIGMKFVSI